MEGVVAEFWRDRRVLITGHTGFKGSWLTLWLNQLGASLSGFALPPATQPSLFAAASLESTLSSRIGDICDGESVKSMFQTVRPEVVFHLAAQPLVRTSYEDPVGTYSTNVMGTINVLEAVRQCDSVRAVVVITTDKCYENREWVWAYRENDRLGGYDPYSSSKACVELLVSSYRNSFFARERYGHHGVAIASVRAGNVIGGGDWSRDRLIPDIMRAFGRGETLQIRHPHAVRPWQHVLEPLWGYLLVAKKMIEHGVEFGEAWNFAPEASDARSVEWIVAQLAREYGDTARWELDQRDHPHEATMLKLDWSKAEHRLHWRPTLTLDTALKFTADWYRRYDAGENARAISLDQIAAFTHLLSNSTAAVRPY